MIMYEEGGGWIIIVVHDWELFFLFCFVLFYFVLFHFILKTSLMNLMQPNPNPKSNPNPNPKSNPNPNPNSNPNPNPDYFRSGP